MNMYKTGIFSSVYLYLETFKKQKNQNEVSVFPLKTTIFYNVFSKYTRNIQSKFKSSTNTETIIPSTLQ